MNCPVCGNVEKVFWEKCKAEWRPFPQDANSFREKLELLKLGAIFWDLSSILYSLLFTFKAEGTENKINNWLFRVSLFFFSLNFEYLQRNNCKTFYFVLVGILKEGSVAIVEKDIFFSFKRISLKNRKNVAVSYYELTLEPKSSSYLNPLIHSIPNAIGKRQKD